MMIANNCTDATFRLTGENGAKNTEVVEVFKDLERPLDQSDNNWPPVLRNIGNARQFWIHLGQLLQREGVDLLVLKKFYHAVVQAVLLFGTETWMLLATMSKKTRGHACGIPKSGNKKEGNMAKISFLAEGGGR